MLTGGEVSDMTAFGPLMDISAPKSERPLANKGYDADRIRERLRDDEMEAVIPPKSNRKTEIACDYRACTDRSSIERMFNRITQNRRIATRYDKTRKSFEAFLALAAVKLWPPTFFNRA